MPQGTNTVALRYVKEVTEGTAPTAGWAELRYTGESLAPTQQTTESAEIIATRESQGAVRTAVGSAGDVNLEWHYGTFDALLQGALGGTWTSDVLKVGTTLDSFSLEKKFPDSTTFELFTGCFVNSLSMDISVGSIMTGAIGFLGRQPSFSGSQTEATAVTAVNANPIWNGIDHISAITEGGGSITGVQKISLAIDNSVRAQNQLGDIDPVGIAPGTFKLSGAITLYYTSATIINKFLNFTDTSLSFKAGGASAKNYVFDIAKVNYTDAKVLATGINGDVLAELSWQAKIDATDTTLKITRTA